MKRFHLNQQTLNNIGYISITIMMGLLLLLWFKIVPDSWAVPFLVIALALVGARIVLRIKLIRMERAALRAQKNDAVRS
jgi:hypothetical protein